MFLEDFDPFFADFAVTANFGGRVAQVLFDMPQAEIFDGMQQSTEYQITFRAGDLAGLKTGDVGYVNNQKFKVRQTTTIDDGKIMTAMLKAA